MFNTKLKDLSKVDIVKYTSEIVDEIMMTSNDMHVRFNYYGNIKIWVYFYKSEFIDCSYFIKVPKIGNTSDKKIVDNILELMSTNVPKLKKSTNKILYNCQEILFDVKNFNDIEHYDDQDNNHSFRINSFEINHFAEISKKWKLSEIINYIVNGYSTNDELKKRIYSEQIIKYFEEIKSITSIFKILIDYYINQGKIPKFYDVVFDFDQDF